MNEWQPIDTAPRDGTSVLINLNSPLTIEKGYWDSLAWNDKRKERGVWRVSGWVTAVEPTHWMTLPPRPPQ